MLCLENRLYGFISNVRLICSRMESRIYISYLILYYLYMKDIVLILALNVEKIETGNL